MTICILKRNVAAFYIISGAVIAFVFFAPTIYQSDHDMCSSNEECTHVTVVHSISYRYIGLGGILYYPLMYEIDSAMYMG